MNYRGPVDLTVYFINDYNIRSTIIESDNTLGIEIEVVLGRRLLGVFFTTYLPTILILFIVHFTHYFKAFYFEAIVTVNLTCEDLVCMQKSII